MKFQSDLPLDIIPADLIVIIHPKLKRSCCEDDPCRAAVYYQLLECIAWKIANGADYWYGSVQDIKTRLLDNSWSHVKINQEIQTLVNQGLLRQEHNSEVKHDRRWYYFFGESEGKHFRESCEIHNVCVRHHLRFSDLLLDVLSHLQAINECCCHVPYKAQEVDSREREIVESKEASRLRRHLEEAKSLGLEATLTLDEWLSILKHFGYRCAYCGGAYQLLEHFIPVVLQGGTSRLNCVPACYPCNARKNNYHPFSIPASFNFDDEIKRVSIYLSL